MLVDKWGAIFRSALLTAMLGVVVSASVLEVHVWQVAVPPAVIMLTRDVVYDWYTSRPAPQPELFEVEVATIITDGRDHGCSSSTTFSGRAWIFISETEISPKCRSIKSQKK